MIQVSSPWVAPVSRAMAGRAEFRAAIAAMTKATPEHTTKSVQISRAVNPVRAFMRGLPRGKMRLSVSFVVSGFHNPQVS
ncbi:hypothetical protein RHCRD62_20192 [Rhodococcus sp. RD6.2]|nr:hypothetical protein RHCRD62_20192 [Rhodococcus sp. RD6.2]